MLIKRLLVFIQFVKKNTAGIGFIKANIEPMAARFQFERAGRVLTNEFLKCIGVLWGNRENYRNGKHIWDNHLRRDITSKKIALLFEF